MPLTSDREQIPNEGAQGVLYLVSTPIGNLDDITLRALKILEQADFILAEDTRRTGSLLSHFQIKKRLISCHEHNETARLKEILEKIGAGAQVALVTDAGTPTISDPGFILVREAIGRGLDVRPIPGVSAAITALSVSGFPTDSFLFLGFPSRKKGRREELLRSLLTETRTVIFYESPQRILGFIDEMKGIAGDREAVLCREMTKIHEEFIRGTLSLISQALMERPVIKGECTLVVKGQDARPVVSEESWIAEIDQALLEPSEKPASLAKRISRAAGVPRNRVYEEILKRINQKSNEGFIDAG